MAILQVLPTDAGLDTLEAIGRWVNLSDAAWRAMSTCLGGVPNVRIMAVPGGVGPVAVKEGGIL